MSFPALRGRITKTRLYPLFSIESKIGSWYILGTNLFNLIIVSTFMLAAVPRVSLDLKCYRELAEEEIEEPEVTLRLIEVEDEAT